MRNAKLLMVPLLGLSQMGCIVAGYSSNGGWFLWPGGLGLVVILLVLYFVFGRRG